MSSTTQRSSGGRRLRRRLMLPLVLLVAIAVQFPVILVVGHLSGHRNVVMAFGALWTAGFVSSFVGPRSVWASPSRVRLYAVLWPFFLWWTVSLLLIVLSPLALVARLALPLTSQSPSQLQSQWLLQGWLVAAIIGAAVALWQRPRIRRHVVYVDGLPASFDGYRVAQISDLHCGPFASGLRVTRWVAAVNALGADLVAVTGDLIASGSSFVPVVAAALGGLRARDGVFASMGNHDYFTDGESLVTALERAGLTVLRNQGVDVVRGDGAIHVAGVDDTWTRRADVDRALSARRADMPVVLLAHDPDLFPQAVDRGVALTLSGHTHGGQVGVPLFARKLNLARVMTPFTTGFYQVGSATLYVNRGLGTTGPPVRLGVPPEIAVFTLRRAAPAAASPVDARRSVFARAHGGLPSAAAGGS